MERITQDSSPMHATKRGWTPRRPLIDQVTNEWQRRSPYRDTAAVDDGLDSGPLQRTWAVIKAPKFQRLGVAFILATIMALVLWYKFLAVFIAENKAAWDTVADLGGPKHDNLFGSNKRVHFPGMIQVSNMDSTYLPRISNSISKDASKNKRLIFIGDIHGSMDELQALLKKAEYNSDNDHILSVGDMINKGPKSKEVVDFLMAHGASCVRGNHEDRVLLLARDLNGGSLAAGLEKQNGNDAMETKAARKLREERQLARSLNQQQIDWLSRCPVILRVGDLGPLGEVVVVHGGLIPGVKLENQDPMSAMNMRIIDLETHMPSQKHSQQGSVPWADFWNDYQRLLPAQRTIFGQKSQAKVVHNTVVYGHDSKRGLRINTYTKGLDSGCVNGKKLTAWIVSDSGRERIVQVGCDEFRGLDNS